MKTEKASSKGSEPESPTPPPAANHSEASSSSTHTDEARPTDRPSRIVSIVAPILEEAVQRCQNEIKISSKRLEECKVISDRLRALVTAMFYSQAGQHDTTNAVLGPRKQPAIHPTTRQFLGKQPPSGFASSSAAQSQSEEVRMPATKAVCSAPATFSASTAALLNSNGKRSHPDRLVPANPFSQPPEMLEGGRDSRHKFKKSVIFGNVSRYLNPERNTDTDGCTFKWKIYLALDKKECGRIEDFVERVTFYLHSSYCPHVISLSKPPFELTKRGWGEFKVRADLSFWDKRNPAKSIYHQLKFSSVESKFGVQLKQETVHVLELFREVPVGVFPSSACPKVGEKRNAPDTSEGVSHVTIAHNSSPPVKIKKENEEPEQVAMKACASRGSTGMASTSASPSNPFKTPLVVKTEPVLPGSPGSPNAAAVSRNSVKIGSTGGISMLSSQGQSLILGTILPPVVSQTASSMNGVAMNTVVLSNGGLGAPRGKMLSAGTSSMLGPRIASQSQPRQISLLKGLPPTSSSGAGVTVVLPAPGKTGLQNSPSRAQTTLPSGHFIINSGSAVLGRTYSPVSAANVTLAPSGIRSSGKELHFIQQPLTAGNGSPLILLKTDSKVFSPGSTSTENKARTGASLVTASSSAKPTMLVFNSASGVQKSIPIQIITTKSITIAGTVSTPSLPIVTCVPSTASASGVKQGAVPKPVETWGLLGGTTCAKSNVFSPAAPSPVRKANSGSVPLPCGGGGSGGTLLPGESDEAMIDVVSCTADDSPAASNPMPETCRGSSKLSEAALSSHSSKLLGRGSVSSSPGVCSSQSSSLPSESSTADAGGVVTLAASIPTASPAKDVLTGAVSSTVLTTVVSRTMSSLASHVPVSAGQTVTCLSTPESGVVSKAASAASPKLCTPSQFISIPSSSLHRAAVPGCSNIGQSNPLMTVLSSSSSSPSLSSSPHPPKAAYIVVKGNPSTASKMDPSSLRQSSTGVPAMRPFKVTPQGLKMVTSQPPTHTAAMVLTSGTNSVTGPKTVTLTFPIAGYKGLPQAVGRTPPTSQNSPSQHSVLTSLQGTTFLLRLSQSSSSSLLSSGPHGNSTTSTLSTKSCSPALYNGLDSLKLASGTGSSEGTKRILGHQPTRKGGMEQVPEVAPLCIADYPDLKSLMRASVKAHPLIQTGVDRSLHPYCAFGLDHWLTWPVAKRRAAEWQRASTVQKFVKKMLGPSGSFQGEAVWSTRQIVVWCRLQALGPYTLEPRGKRAKAALSLEGLPPQRTLQGPLYVRDLIPSTMAADRSDFLDACLEDDSDDSDVEIMDCSPGPGAGMRVKTEVKEEPADPCSFQECPTEEDWFVRDTVEQLNVKLRSVELEQECLVPATERMLYTAMKQFAARLLQEAHSASLTRDSDAGEITAKDVAQAARSVGGSEFLACTQLQMEQVEEADWEDS